VPGAFTFAAFEGFCQRVAALPVFTVADYLDCEKPPRAPFVVLRFDVDYREPHAVQMAHIAARHRLRGSFYFRHHANGFDLPVMRAVAALGHETGYHFETLDTCQGNVTRARALFLAHIAQLRAVGLTIRTVAAHGSPPAAPGYRSNRDLMAGAPGLLAESGLLGETTFSMDFGRVDYVSDAFWRWRRYSRYIPEANSGQPIALHLLPGAVVQDGVGLYVNFHPHQWFAHPLSAAAYRLRNQIGRRVVPVLRRIRQ
jgi:hypothetical protein